MRFEWLWRDVRHGLRLFAKSPGFAAVAVISIACGTGANVAMFSAADTLMLRPLPVRDPAERKDVGAMIDHLTRHLLGGHVPHRAEHGAWRRLPRHRWAFARAGEDRVGLCQFGEAEVQNREVAVTNTFSGFRSR